MVKIILKYKLRFKIELNIKIKPLFFSKFFMQALYP